MNICSCCIGRMILLYDMVWVIVKCCNVVVNLFKSSMLVYDVEVLFVQVMSIGEFEDVEVVVDVDNNVFL